MKKALLAWLLAVSPFAFSPCALALDPGSGVTATTLVKTTTNWNGRPLAWPTGQAEATAMIITIAPGAETGWHWHPGPSFAVVLEGELQVRTEEGQVHVAKAGDAFSEVVDTVHSGTNIGTTPVKLVVFYAGAVGQPLSVKGKK